MAALTFSGWFKHPEGLVESLDLRIEDLKLFRQMTHPRQFGFDALFTADEFRVGFLEEVERRGGDACREGCGYRCRRRGRGRFRWLLDAFRRRAGFLGILDVRGYFQPLGILLGGGGFGCGRPTPVAEGMSVRRRGSESLKMSLTTCILAEDVVGS